MKPILMIMFVALMAFVNSCSKSIDLKEGIAELKLNQCGTGIISGNDLSLCFSSVESDSRCPANAMCIWAGTAICNFTFIKNGDTHQLKLATLAVPGTPKDTTVAGFKIEFLNLSPYPGTTNGSIKDKERKAEIKITKI
jgi:hypothetical protein